MCTHQNNALCNLYTVRIYTRLPNGQLERYEVGLQLPGVGRDVECEAMRVLVLLKIFLVDRLCAWMGKVRVCACVHVCMRVHTFNFYAWMDQVCAHV